MKFHEPNADARLKRLADEALKSSGDTAESPDDRPFGRGKLPLPLLILSLLAFPAMFAFLMGWQNRLAVPGWQMLIGGAAMLIAAMDLSSRLVNITFRAQTVEALLRLPVPGVHVLQWIRAEAFRRSRFAGLWALVCAWCWLGFPLNAPAIPFVISHALLLWGITFATAILYTHPGVQKLRLPVLWLSIIAGTALMAIWNWGYSRLGPPVWLTSASEAVSWLLPPAWVYPSRVSGWGGVLALAWAACGTWWCWRWPAVLGPLLDQAPPLPPVLVDGGDGDLQWSPLAGDAEEEPVASLEGLSAGPFRGDLPQPVQLPGDGWIERLAWSFLTERDRKMAVSLVSLRPDWSSAWKSSLLGCLVVLSLAWIVRQFGPVLPAGWAEFALRWAWAPLLMVLGPVLPISNLLTRASSVWSFGNHGMPFFAAMPVGVRDLLRISTRLTMARCIPVAVLALPACVVLASIFGQSPLFAFKLIPALLVLWALSRPLFIYYRLQEQVTSRRGARLGHVLTTTVIALLATAWVLSAILMTIFCLISSESARQQNAWLAILIALSIAAVCARLIFEIFHWRLRSGKLDLMHCL